MAEKTQSLADVQAECEAKMEKALDGAKTKLKTELDLAVLTFESIVKAGAKEIWKDTNIAPILKTLGLQPIPTNPPTEPKPRTKTRKTARKRGPNKPKVELNSVNVLTYIGSQKKRLGELTAHFGMKVKPLLVQLEQERKVTKETDKSTGGKPATVYANASRE